jgi:hypothetical protein
MLARAIRMAESTALLCALWGTALMMQGLLRLEEARRARPDRPRLT